MSLLQSLVDGRLEFASPWLLLAAPLALVLVWAARRRGARDVGFPSTSLADGLPTTWRVRLAWLPVACLGAGLVLAAVALARPRLGDDRTVVRTEGIAIGLVVDTSGSMWAHDFTGPDGEPTDRLSAVKSVVRNFVEGGDELPGRAGDLLGLTIFAGYADAPCPLTLDHALLIETLDSAEIAKTRFEDGTSIAQGLAVALGSLRDVEAESRVVILLTDGVHNDPDTDPRDAVTIAKELGIRVYTIGMGTTGTAPYPVEQPDGTIRFQLRNVQIDEGLLNEIAAETGGVYQRAGNTEALQAIYGEIDRLERVELEGVTYRRWSELFTFPLAAAAALWLLAFLFEATLFRRLG
jgi:Ca-activated chloride channel family protein